MSIYVLTENKPLFEEVFKRFPEVNELHEVVWDKKKELCQSQIDLCVYSVIHKIGYEDFYSAILKLDKKYPHMLSTVVSYCERALYSYDIEYRVPCLVKGEESSFDVVLIC